MKLEEKNSKSEVVTKAAYKCPICHPESGKGVLCDEHEVLIHDYNKLRLFINSLEDFNEGILYLLDNATGNRVSYVVSVHSSRLAGDVKQNPHKRVKVINGKLAIDEYLKEKISDKIENNKEVTCSVWLERTLLEIKALRKCRSKIAEIIKNKKIGSQGG